MSLPSGYKRLEYIQSSGTQYIDTRFIPTSNTKISIDFHVLSAGVDDTIIGTINPNCVIGYSTTEIHAGFKLGTGAPIAIATTVTSRHTAELSNGVFKVDAQQKSFEQVTGFSQTLTALVFASHYTGVSDGAYGKCAAKVYSAKIYESGVLVRDFIPCKNTSGVIGLWDDVNSVFYQNAGSGTFTAGAEIKSAHRTLVDGTGYDITAGKCLIGGTAYALKKGRTLISGTGYDLALKASDGRTWLLNELLHPFWAKYEVTFVSNGKSFHAFYGYGTASWFLYYVDTIGDMEVYRSGTWKNEAYRTVEFDEAPTGDLLTWLEANGTRV